MVPFASRRILAATDFSEVSTWALHHAVTWARHYGSHLTVLHVQDFPPSGDNAYWHLRFGELLEEKQEATTRQLAEYVKQHVPADLTVSPLQLSGSPPREIEEYAAAMGASLVVLGTHSREGFTRLLMGSVAERTLRVARRPTLIIRELTGRENFLPEVPHVRHILCPVNYTEVARAAFESAYSVAQTFGARLTVAYSVEPDGGALLPDHLKEAEDRLWYWIPPAAAKECQLQPAVRHGNAAEQIITLAREADVDLIVLGAQHRAFVDSTVLGVTTVRVTRHAPCPVLVVPRSHTA
jgi:nucleotide-binding universal stress UspA family protein